MTTANGRREILIFCTRQPGLDDSPLIAELQNLGARFADSELAALLPKDALPALAHVAEAGDALPDAIVTLRWEQHALGSLSGMIATLARLIDRERSSVLVVQRHAILPGGDAIRLFFGLRRLERLTLAQFHDYWLNRHAELGRRLIPPYTYHQLHADPTATAALARSLDLQASTFDGVVEVHFPDLDAFVKQLSRPEVAEEALADERNFIDHSRSVFWAYRTLSHHQTQPPSNVHSRSQARQKN
jgi:hypothetical protein